MALRAKSRRGTAGRPSKAAKVEPQESPADFMSAGFHFALGPLLLRYVIFLLRSLFFLWGRGAAELVTFFLQQKRRNASGSLLRAQRVHHYFSDALIADSAGSFVSINSIASLTIS